ncbi:pseudouridine synthase [Clostridium niameyense]|uniref:pseudouridine synthase n=1 Tax=Clostridium niameyense TaxID=1622073 RepID=UPI00067F70D3|nr:pseudouridine synthase [Clostridium niameyense]
MEERLQKYMASCGVGSRRKCEEIILQGRVSVNSKRITQLGTKVIPEEDKVYLDGKLITPEENKVYILLNKPKGYISTVQDEKGRKTILDLVHVKERIYPIGRLDKDSSGIIILTNDGEIYNKIIHPSKEKVKTYRVLVDGILDENHIKRFKEGIDIGGYITAPAILDIVKIYKNSTEVLIKIYEGKNRQIRRMCESIGHRVLQLDRIAIGDIKKGDLKQGTWRNLTSQEIEYLKKV